MEGSIDTVIVGAGQAGLVMSAFLRDQAREHVLLDRRATLGGGWHDRWDAFRLVGPNWTTSVPGYDYQGSEPDGFMPRDEIIEHWRGYGQAIEAPVEFNTEVRRISSRASGSGRFDVETSSGTIAARSVVVAAGPFQRAHVPAMAAGLAPSILSLHVDAYRNPGALPPGGVLLVGSGQSGVQLAEELATAGRDVTIAVGRCGSVPRRYRDRDVFWWLRQLATLGRELGTALPTADRLPSPAARFACNPQLSGHGGGHEVNLRQMAASGIRLAGRLDALDGSLATFRPDLNENLAAADRFFSERLRGLCDTLAERAGWDLATETPASFAFDVPEVTELDLGAEGIGTVLWTTGYRPDFSWIEEPVFDDFGLPIQTAGMTERLGLGFIGTPWLVDMGSANLVGLVRDAEALASQIAAA